MGSQKGKLFELANLHRARKKKAVKVTTHDASSPRKKSKVSGRHFDEGKAISLSYNVEAYPEIVHSSPSASLSTWEPSHSEAFYIEAFDADDSAAIQYGEVIESTMEDKLDNVVRGFSKESDAEETMEDHEDGLGAIEAKIDNMIPSIEEDEAEGSDNDSNSEEMGHAVGNDGKNVGEDPPIGEAATETSNAFSYDASDEEFAQDIGAILQGQKVYDSEQKKAVGREIPSNSSPAPSSVKEKPAEDVLDAGRNEHKIFEKIAQSMTYANSYDLGALALEEKFQLMDQQIEKDTIKGVLSHQPSANDDSVGQQDAAILDDGLDAVAMSDNDYYGSAPLSAENGGRYLSPSDLQTGDLVLATQKGSNGLSCVAGLYTGSDIISAQEGEALERLDLSKFVSDNAVILRHKEVDSSRAGSVVTHLTKLSQIGRLPPEELRDVKLNPVSIHPDVCRKAGSGSQAKCEAFNGRILLGTSSNDLFRCPGSLIAQFDKHQLPIVVPLSNEHNGSLQYFGHLKLN